MNRIQRPARAAGRWLPALVRDTLVCGSIASVLSTVAVALAGRCRGLPLASTTNASSHWIWGDRAFNALDPDLRHTATGYVIHHLSSLLWAGVHAASRQLAPRASPGSRALGVAAIAAVVDYGVVPRRLTPGFEAHLRPPAIALAYLAFASGLVAGTALRRGSRAAPR